MAFFRTRLATVWNKTGEREEQLYFNEMLEALNEGLSIETLFGTAEATAACEAMSDENELMLSDGIVYRI